MIVVDSNVIAYFFLPGDYAAAAEALYRRDPQWAAPVLWRSEFRNLLAGYLRRGQMSLEQALALQTAAQRLLQGNEYESDSEAVLRLVHTSACSAYDCEFAALAQRLGVPLFTMDAKLRRAFPALAVSMVEADAGG